MAGIKTFTLRSKDYAAEHLTDLNYLPLGNLFVEEDGQFALQDIDDYDSLSSQTKVKLTQPLLKRLSDPDKKAAIAQSLSAIFPLLPRDLVSYQGKGNFTLNLTISELLKIAIFCGNNVRGQEENPTPSYPKVEKAVSIEELQQQLDLLRQNSAII